MVEVYLEAVLGRGYRKCMSSISAGFGLGRPREDAGDPRREASERVEGENGDLSRVFYAIWVAPVPGGTCFCCGSYHHWQRCIFSRPRPAGLSSLSSTALLQPPRHLLQDPPPLPRDESGFR